jgi:hypothetical protein
MAFGDVELGTDVVPVTSLKKCGTTSNLDPVKFIWRRNTFCFLRYSMCMIPTTSPYLVFLRHYRADSDG